MELCKPLHRKTQIKKKKSMCPYKEKNNFSPKKIKTLFSEKKMVNDQAGRDGAHSSLIKLARTRVALDSVMVECRPGCTGTSK